MNDFRKRWIKFEQKWANVLQKWANRVKITKLDQRGTNFEKDEQIREKKIKKFK